MQRKKTHPIVLREDRPTKLHSLAFKNVSSIQDHWWRKSDDVTSKKIHLKQRLFSVFTTLSQLDVHMVSNPGQLANVKLFHK